MDFFFIAASPSPSPCPAKSNHGLISLNELPSASLSKVVYLWEKCESCFELFSSMGFPCPPTQIWGLSKSNHTIGLLFDQYLWGKWESFLWGIKMRENLWWLFCFLGLIGHSPFYPNVWENKKFGSGFSTSSRKECFFEGFMPIYFFWNMQISL